jgi:GT2 family glycosyltransferase
MSGAESARGRPVTADRRPGERRRLASPGAPPPPGQADHPERLARVRAEGKFLVADGETLWVRGVTYGTFRPDALGQEFHDRERGERDFAQMAANGMNAVRTYTVPPRWLLDAAERYALRVMVGLPWEQHVAFLDERARARAIVERVREGVSACAGHPAVLCYAIGNEIPAPIVRWHGRRRVERFVEQLYRAAKAEDPEGLVTYVNYPTTEYLHLPFLDLACFNVYLESRDRLDAYLARLHNLAGERPLLMAEIGLDSRRHGEDTQAHVLHRQLRTAFGSGCAGAFVFAWTDEWHRGGHDIEDWDFGLTDRERRPKAALAAVSAALGEVPFPKSWPWPRVSVVVCTFNGARTIRNCLEGLLRLDYPDFEVIVVNDGSRDRTAAIAHEYGFRVISTENRGLSAARNTGWQAASGEIVAYIDDDAYPDPHWLRYLAATFLQTDVVGAGGPNLPPPGDGAIAECVANAPGGPVHVLVGDREAEHIPGCNMAFRRTALEAIGGFDRRFRTAGDDVDLCWRLQDQGWRIGFHPAAVVWHHRRNSVRAYWRQQQGYGRAEALLEQKWPERYNAAGHLTWAGRLYGRGVTAALLLSRGRVYQGTWGSAPFQSLYQPGPGTLAALPLMPEWYLVVAALAGLSLLGLSWAPLLAAVPLLGLAVGAPVVQACRSASRAVFPTSPRSRWRRFGMRAFTGFLHLAQPVARLRGRFRQGLTPWRRRGGVGFALPWPRTYTTWRETWRSQEETLAALERALRDAGAVVRRGGDFDRWDLEVRGGLLGSARLAMAVEEHGAGRQLLRFRVSPWVSRGALLVLTGVGALAVGSAASGSRVAAGSLLAAALILGRQIWRECAIPVAGLADVLADAGATRQPCPWRSMLVTTGAARGSRK